MPAVNNASEAEMAADRSRCRWAGVGLPMVEEDAEPSADMLQPVAKQAPLDLGGPPPAPPRGQALLALLEDGGTVRSAQRHVIHAASPIDPPLKDPVSTFNLLLKLIKRVTFSLMQRAPSSRLCTCDQAQEEQEHVADLSYEAAACRLDALLVRWFRHEPRPLPRSLHLRGCSLARAHPGTHPRRRAHVACAQPHFPTDVMARVAESNHILQSHLVQGDPCVAVMSSVLRSAMQFTQDFAVVVALVVQDFAVRKRTEMKQAGGPLVGYAYEAVTVRFLNFRHEHSGRWLPVVWSVTFPSRKILAAFWSHKRMWATGLQHVPCFTAVEVGQKQSAHQWRNPQRHTLSPQLLTVWPLSRRDSSGALPEIHLTAAAETRERLGGSTSLRMHRDAGASASASASAGAVQRGRSRST